MLSIFPYGTLTCRWPQLNRRVSYFWSVIPFFCELRPNVYVALACNGHGTCWARRSRREIRLSRYC